MIDKWSKNKRSIDDSEKYAALHLARFVFVASLILSLSSVLLGLAAESGAPIPPERFSADY